MILDGKRYRIVYEAHGAYIRADGKRAIEEIGFMGVEPL